MIQFRLLGLSGSLRHSSYSTAVLRSLRASLAPRAALEIFPLHGVPLYNEDDDAEHSPESVRSLRSAIEASDGVIMISPEYNHGMSGVLKNALDWISRPHGLSVLRKKPVLTMTASPAFTGGVRAQQQMNETLAAIQALPVLRPQIVIGGVHQKVRAMVALSTRRCLASRSRVSMICSKQSGQRAASERRPEAVVARTGAASACGA